MSEDREDIFEAQKRKKPEAPKWFKRETMFAAELDLSEIADGAMVTLRSAKGREAKRIQRLAPTVKRWGKNKAGEDIPLELEPESWESVAAKFAAHVDVVSGLDDLVEGPRPEKRSSLKEWQDWLDGMDENALGLIEAGIIFFRNDVFSNEKDSGESGNESKQPSEG